MRRLLKLLLLTFLATAAGAQDSFIWRFDFALESGLGYGMLHPAVTSAPGEFGADAVVTDADLRAAGSQFTSQLSFGTAADAALLLRWQLDGLAIEADTSVLARHAPFGYWPGTGMAVAPGPLGVRAVWDRPDPASWGFSVGAGRHRLVDPTGLVLDQLVDGILLSGGSDYLYLTLGGGFTGLVDKYFYSPRVTPGDGAVFGQSGFFAPNRLLAQLRAELAIAPEHVLALTSILYEDLESGVDGSNVLVQLAAAGSFPIGPPVATGDGGWPPLRAPGAISHETQVTVQIPIAGSTPALFLSSRIELRLPSLPIVAGVGGLFASGGGTLGLYTPLNSAPTGLLAAVPAQNLVRLDLDATVSTSLAQRPIQPTVGARLFLTPNPSAGDVPFLGVEATGGVTYELLSDLTLDASAGFATMPTGFSPLFSLSGRLTL